VISRSRRVARPPRRAWAGRARWRLITGDLFATESSDFPAMGVFSTTVRTPRQASRSGRATQLNETTDPSGRWALSSPSQSFGSRAQRVLAPRVRPGADHGQQTSRRCRMR
jgi:hypothetical protein